MEPKDEEFDPVAEAAKLPLSERVAHKHWKVRENAYRELATKFHNAEENAKIYTDFFSTIGRIVRDANAPAQLVGFDAVSNYADCAPPPLVRRVAADAAKGIVEKGLAGRPANKQKAIATFLMFVGADAGDLAADAIVSAGFKHRTPKVVVAAVDAITQAVDTYGSSAIPVKPIATKLSPLFNHSQESVRNAAKALIIMLHRWVGDPVKVVLKDAKDVIIKEMETVFAKHASLPKPKPKKLTRAMEQRVRTRGGGGEDVNLDDGFGEAAAEEEELDLAVEINLMETLAKLKIQVDAEENIMKDWFTAVDSKKWNVRKDSLDTAVKVIGEHKLTPVSHQEIFSRLRKIIAKDPNVNVAASAAKLVSAMAGGLKKNFPPGMAKALMSDLFGRLKEKNRIVTDAVSATLDALHQRKCLRFFENLDEISAAAAHKVPKARCALLLWVGRCILSGTAGVDLKGTPFKTLAAMFVKATDDSSPEVRDAALSGLAALQKLVGDRNVNPYLEKLDKKRKDKVAAIVAKLPDPSKAPSQSAAQSPGSKAGPAANTRAKVAKRASASPSVKASATSPTTTKPRRKKRKVKKPPIQQESDDEGEGTFSPEAALAAAEERFEGFEADNWKVKSFKARAAAVGFVSSSLGEKESLSAEDVSLVLGLLSNDPGLADSNFIAAKPKLELFGMVANKCTGPLPRKTLRPLLSAAMEKLGDLKSSKMVAGLLMSFAEATSPRYFLEILAECGKNTKNSRALIGMLKMAGSVVEEFGVPAVPEKPVVELAAPNTSNGASAAKNGAVSLACKLGCRIGAEKMRGLLEQAGCESDGLEAFDSEMEKYTREPDPPSRKKKFENPMITPESEEEEYEEEDEESTTTGTTESTTVLPPESTDNPAAEVVDESVLEQEAPVAVTAAPKRARAAPNPAAPKRAVKSPTVSEKATTQTPPTAAPSTPPPPTERVSVAHEFAPGARIFLELKNSNWKKRQDALASIQAILEGARNHIKANVGNDIIMALRMRLSDSNRNLATMAYDVVDQFVRAMGSGGAIYLKVLAPAIFGQGCIDIKKNVREAAMRALEGCFETFGLSLLIPYCPLPLASLNAVVRKGFLEWLVPRLKGTVGSFNSANEDLACLIDSCLICLRDKTAEVRHLADMCFEQIVKSVGVVVIDNKVATLTKAARLQLEPILEKYRVAQAEAATNASSQPPKASSGATPRAGRERPRSVAVPRTPLHKRGAATAATGDEENTPVAGNRKQRPASARVTPVVSAQMAALSTPDPAEVPLLKSNNGRDERARRYMNKRLQFVQELSNSNPAGNMPPLIGEGIDDIAADLKDCCSTKLYSKLTAPANRFRMHVEATELVIKELEDKPDSFSSVADVLFRWAACRIDDSKTPPTVLVKLAGFVSHMCELLISSDVKLGNYEASAILPPLIEKVGSNRESVRVAMQSAILSIGDVVEDEVLLVLFTSCFQKPYSVRSHAEVVKGVNRLIAKRFANGAGIPPGVLPTIGRIAGGSDEAAGRAAAACIERAHEFFGDDLWAHVGELSNEEARLLDVRLTSVMNSMKQGRMQNTPGQEYDIGGEMEAGTPQPEMDAYYPGPSPVINPGNAINHPASQPLAHPSSHPDAHVNHGVGHPMSHTPMHPASHQMTPRTQANPNDIRNEDFRLSVAPAPPASVLTSISDSLNAATPMRTREELRMDAMPQTPAMPSRQMNVDPEDEVEQLGTEVLNRLHSPDRDVQLSGLATIFENLREDSSLLRSVMGAKICLRLVRCFGDTLDRLESGNPLEDDAAVLKSFLKGVIRFAREPDVLRRLDQSSVEFLLSDALNAMIPQEVEGVDDWDQIRRGVNLMIVKVLESCDQNLLFTAMINLLLANIRMMQKGSTDKMPALAKSSICIKSIAKVAKRGFAECRVNALLRDIHVFLKANPVRRDGVSSSEDQTFAMRLLKTVVNAVIEEIGGEILNKLDLIAQPEKSQLVQYVEMTLKDQGHNAGPVSSQSPQYGEGYGDSKGSALSSGRPSASPVGVSRTGGSSAAIMERRVDAEKSPDAHGSGSRQGAEGGTNEDGGGNAEAGGVGGGLGRKSGQEYRDRLKELQRRHGLNTRSGSEGNAPSLVEKENGSSGRAPSGEEMRGKASWLRERMARIREMESSGKEP